VKYNYGDSPQGSVAEPAIAPGAPFESVSRTYDSTFSTSAIGRAQRNSVWRELNRNFQKGHRILEINCGTGVDALHLAGRGVQVVACDSAPGMIAVARSRLDASSNNSLVEFRCLATEQIAQLECDGPYDGVLSNFSGLNCLSDLKTVARDLAPLVKPGGRAIVCVFGCFCLWEIFWYLAHGNFQKAFRRLRRKGVEATLAPGSTVIVKYVSIEALKRDFSPYFRLAKWSGVGVAVPPSYLEALAVRFPRLFRLAAKIDPELGACPGFRSLADHVVLTFERSNA
jgi:ubiquinone/menaquinone biosynthesis C-methylase UbiE